MNKIKFSSGGQPLFLEDVKLLQDNQEKMLETLLYALCEDNNVLLSGGEIELEGDDYVIRGGKAFIGGDIVEWDTLNLGGEEQLNDDIFLCVRELEEDEREFGDGFMRKCRINRNVYLNNTTEGSIGYINMLNPYRFDTVLKGVLGFSSSSLSWYKEEIHEELIYNGFDDIEILHVPTTGGVQIKLNMSSKNAAWGDNVKGVICSWPGELATRLKGKYTPVIFVGGDGKVYSDIIEWARDGTELCLLDAGGGEVKHSPYGEIKGQFTIY